MSIATAIIAAQGRVADAYTAVNNKGGMLPATQNLSNLPTAINSIPSGSGGVDNEYIYAWTSLTASNLVYCAYSKTETPSVGDTVRAFSYDLTTNSYVNYTDYTITSVADSGTERSINIDFYRYVRTSYNDWVSIFRPRVQLTLTLEDDIDMQTGDGLIVKPIVKPKSYSEGTTRTIYLPNNCTDFQFKAHYFLATPFVAASSSNCYLIYQDQYIVEIGIIDATKPAVCYLQGNY